MYSTFSSISFIGNAKKKDTPLDTAATWDRRECEKIREHEFRMLC